MAKKSDELIPIGKQDVSRDTRFSRHNVYADKEKSFFETWKVPEVPPHPLDKFHTVEAGQEGLRGITLISYEYYNRVDLWWFIAAVNGIFCPSVDVVPGIELRIPPLERVYQFIV